MKTILRKTLLAALAAVLMPCLQASAQDKWTLSSPDGNQELTVATSGARLYYSLKYKGTLLISRAYLSLSLSDGEIWGRSVKVQGTDSIGIDETYDTPVWIRAKARNKCNQLTLKMSRDYNVVFRAYDDGVAYRFESNRTGSYNILDEEVNVTFNSAPNAYVSYTDNSGFENQYTATAYNSLSSDKLIINPALFSFSKAKMCFTESDVKDYPTMFLLKGGALRSIEGRFVRTPKSETWKSSNEGMLVAKENEMCIAECSGERTFPWRVMMVSDDEGTFLSSDMLFVLGQAPEDTDWSWVKPGQAVWDWWCNTLDGVDFTVGMNTETWLYRIDFAAKHNIPYVLIDAGWANTALSSVSSDMDLEKIVAYGKERNVGVMLWGFGFRFAANLESLCSKYSAMGVKGFKLDFWERTDQKAIKTIERVAKTAAKYKLLIDYHGCWPVGGLNRTYPNVIDFEGVHGGEQFKWDGISVDQVTYDVTFPFIRMVAAPVDYTQGAMRNGTKSTYKVNYSNPMSQGTRCRQLAEYVVFYSPVTMWVDKVTTYEQEAECANFIAKIPTVWDETKSLTNRITQYVSVARRSGDEWFVGALTNWNSRSLTLDLSFLGDGDYAAEVFADGDNANTDATDYKTSTIDIPSSRSLTVELAQGGGYAMRIYKK